MDMKEVSGFILTIGIVIGLLSITYIFPSIDNFAGEIAFTDTHDSYTNIYFVDGREITIYQRVSFGNVNGKVCFFEIERRFFLTLYQKDKLLKFGCNEGD